MTPKPTPSVDERRSHEEAAAKIRKLRRKGVPCHLEDHPDRTGHHVHVIQDESTVRQLPPLCDP